MVDFEELYDAYMCTDCDKNCKVRCIDGPTKCLHTGDRVDWERIGKIVKDVQKEGLGLDLKGPVKEGLKFIGEDRTRWESYEYFMDSQGRIWVRWSLSGGNSQRTEWFEEGFDVEEKSTARMCTRRAIKDKIEMIRKEITEGN